VKKLIQIPGFELTEATYEGVTRPMYRGGSGPGVIVIHEIPGITPPVADYGRRLIAAGFTVFMPSLFGTPGKEKTTGYTLSTIARACVSKEFHCIALNRPSPITTWLRALARDAHGELGGPGIGVVGMCLTGGFGLAMLVEPAVIAPVLSQPATPFPIGGKRKASLGLSTEDWAKVEQRIDEGCAVLGLRFTKDPSVPDERFATLKEHLGDNFIAVDIDSSEDNPHGISTKAHSVLTEDLVDEPGHPTAAALQETIEFFQTRLG
jgi:dienelactone hydrolase